MSKGCKYCNNNEIKGEINEKILQKNPFGKYLPNSGLVVWLSEIGTCDLWIDDGCDFHLLGSKKIKFCPMCGRKFTKGE